MTQPPIEVDPAAASDNDSVIDDQLSEFTASLTSSVTDYPVEYGRRYHAFRSGVYCLPNDELELDRLDLTHALMTKGIGGKLYLAPIEAEKLHRILDIGTGTGIWSICMGDDLPNAEVLGNDLSAVQPTWVPPNVKFEIDDVESPWSHPVPFDYIFCRYMAACISDWPKLVKNIYRNLAPNGWAEFQDFDLQYYSEDGSLTDSSDTIKWINTLLSAARKIGRDPCPGVKLEERVREAGFKNVTHRRFKFPVGPWPKDRNMKEIGMYNLAQVLQGLEAFSLRLFCDVLGWQKEEVLVLTSKVRKELKSPAIHAQFDFHVVYGQKP
ncbi:S-adenosyl-L-methionine-dependent methyltransferase [Phialemonium atrogriseum]|uniref:S-adenosyl-L-methionine-dependent methyltransferase n=1 Tax=Phialemonium atrogriseum TaxID=1093897 RepID=A0AAJ0FMB6_9PEZI|nr:S-adenosyl-L-methionine-dependent methyltransferase [Phialemonium atrogriseum]KAK1765975.1 S-adenosyl-L-methionine-dependent methyltransferase [Phialemonium atrogriseum]